MKDMDSATLTSANVNVIIKSYTMTNTKHKDFAGKGNVDARNNRQNKELQNEGGTRQTMEERFDEQIPGIAIDHASEKHHHDTIKAFITSELRLLLTELVGKKTITIEDAIDGGEHISDVVLFEDILSSFRERGVEL